MKVILLAGGLGTRLAEFTDVIPKPMVSVGDHPVLWHLMNYYASFGHRDFHVALGYKAKVVKEYFLNYHALNSDFTVDLATGTLEHHSVHPVNWKVTLVDTGLNSMTGGRVKRMKSFIGDEPFLLTYGDGLSNVDLQALVEFHKAHGKMVTVTAVHPGARFGELDLNGCSVTSFKEKPQMGNGWINGGFFVVEPRFLDLIAGDDTVLEKEPLEQAAAMGELMAYQHPGFWQCMDTVRDRNVLEELWANNRAPWRVWKDQ
jgi:glucose-1-phosphate cytidylyltransferase